MELTILGEYVADLPLSEFANFPKIINKEENKIGVFRYNKTIQEFVVPDEFKRRKKLSPSVHIDTLNVPKERVFFGHRLLDGVQDIQDFVWGGICHDTTAYVRHLLGTEFSTEMITTTSPNNWEGAFQFKNGFEWDGKKLFQAERLLVFTMTQMV